MASSDKNTGENASLVKFNENNIETCHNLKSDEQDGNLLGIDLKSELESSSEKNQKELKSILKPNQSEIKSNPTRGNIQFKSQLTSANTEKTQYDNDLEVSQRMNNKIKIEIIGLFNKGIVKTALHTEFKQSLEDKLREGIESNEEVRSPVKSRTRSPPRPQTKRSRRVFEEDNPDDDSSDSPRQSPPRLPRVRSNTTNSRTPAFTTSGQRHRYTGNSTYRRNTVGPSLPEEIGIRLARYNLSEHQRETIVADIQNLVSNQVVSTQLSGEFRGTLELHLQRRADRISEGMDPEDIVEDIQRRGDTISPRQAETFVNTASEPRPVASTQAIREVTRQLEDLKLQMGDLHRMMRVSFEVQQYIQRSIRQEVASAMNSFMTHNCGGPQVLATQNMAVPNVTISGEPMPGTITPASYGMCVVCRQNQIDSMIYRCGHMCVCQPCGYELIGQKLKCPMCRSPIVDVVKVYKTSA